jgi:hypothetical protein
MTISSYPNLVYLDQVTGGNTIAFPPNGVDAFGRLRISQPITLFDSSHRYADNDLWAELTAGGGSSSFVAAEGLIDMDVGTASGDSVIRETFKVFSYQPGKSLLTMNTFVMGEAKANLRQRVGYFNADNGIFLERDGTTVNFVKRSLVTGSATDTKVAQASWNGDKLDGTGPSGFTLDLEYAQIMWADIEWLGLGSVRVGFIINGKFIICHTFHHANLVTTTYITTASLPLRYEITNTDTTASASKLKQVCSTVISEGGYELSGRQQAVGTVITSPYSLTTAGTYYPVVSLRLKSAREDAIAILTAASVLGVSSANYNWRVIARSTTTGGTWVSAGTNSSLEYNLTGTATTGGRILASGFFSTTNQATGAINLLKEALFKFQLERDSLNSTYYEVSLVMSAGTSTSSVLASLDWEEVSR